MSANGSRADKFALAFVALILAVLLWLQVSAQGAVVKEREMTVKVDYRNVPEGMTAITVTDYVQAVISGPQAKVDSVDPTEVAPYIDLANVKPGQYEVALKVPDLGPQVNIRLPKPRVSMVLERLQSRSLLVEVRTSGSMAPGLRYNGATVQPERVVIEGPESAIRRANHASVLLGLASVAAGNRLELDVAITDDKGVPVPLARPSPEKVEVSPAVEASEASNRFFVSPTWSGQLPAGHRLVKYTVTPNRVLVRGESGRIAGLSVLSTEAVDLTRLRETTTVRKKVILPEGILADGLAEVEIRLEIVRD